MSFGASRLTHTPFLVRYGAATVLVFIAALMRFGMSFLVSRPVSAPLFLTAVICSAWFGGLRLGIYASVVSGLVLDLYFAQPAGGLTTYDHLIRLVMFISEGTLVSWAINKLRVASDELVASREELRSLSNRQRLERDAELKEIAREIHDELGSALTSIKLDIHLLKKQVESVNPGLADQLATGFDEVSERVDQTIEKVRGISSELRPSILDDFGLVAALEWQVKNFSKKSGIASEFKFDSESLALDDDANTAVFRIVQEALTNIARHANATNAAVSVSQTNGHLMVCVDDDGRGIDKAMLTGIDSMGLLGMRERARLINGELTIGQRESPGGTRVELKIPISNDVSGSEDEQ